MRKHFIQIVSLLLIASFILSAEFFVLPLVYAQQDYSLVEQIINKYAPANEEFSVKDYKLLKSPSREDYAYTLYELSPHGYAVLLNETTSLMEANFSEQVEIPIELHTNDVIYYCGPKTFINEEDYAEDNMLSALERRARDYEERKIQDTQNVQTSSNLERTGGVTSSYVEQYYFSNQVNTGENVHGTCTVIAICMLLRYYDYFISDKYMPDVYESGLGFSNDFHELMNDYVYGDGEETGIFIHNAIVGANSYLNEREITTEFDYSNTNQVCDVIIDKIESGYPVIASMATDYEAPYNHSVLIYGVIYDESNYVDIPKFVVHMGWGASQTAFVATSSWFYECGYIECELTSHVYNGVCSFVGPSTHKTHCECGAFTTGLHFFNTTIGGDVCRMCGYVRLVEASSYLN